MGPAHPDDVLDFAGLTDMSGLDRIMDQQDRKKCNHQPLLKLSTKRMYELYDGTKRILEGRFSAVHEIPIGDKGEAILEESRLLEFCKEPVKGRK